MLSRGVAIARNLINGGTIPSGYRMLPAVCPTVQKSPKDAKKQWEYFYWSISATVPCIDLATIIISGTVVYTEYQVNSAGLLWKIWATAAEIMPIDWVWVRKVMLVASNELLAIAKPTPDETVPLKTGPQKTLDLLKEFNAQMSLRMMFLWVRRVSAGVGITIRSHRHPPDQATQSPLSLCLVSASDRLQFFSLDLLPSVVIMNPVLVQAAAVFLAAAGTRESPVQRKTFASLTNGKLACLNAKAC
ncbi:hypothetical protein JX266_009440 [Neoarthrinium moseri]|nr:hypothetical protein JX266_009440 [Neoarthrinium moseri]